MLSKFISNSAIIWEGISLLDNQTPIVAIATGFDAGTNSKLGLDVVSVSVIRQDIKPHEAVTSGQDTPVCGDCPFSSGRGCYVNVAYPTTQIYTSYRKGRYTKISARQLKVLKYKVLRLTAYGEIVAVPSEAIYPLIEVADSTLGYTHQWRSGLAVPYKPHLMASVATKAEAELAQFMGWKTFRVMSLAGKKEKGEILCPNQASEKKIRCETCRLCDGKTANIAIYPTGLGHKIKAIDHYIQEKEVEQETPK